MDNIILAIASLVAYAVYIFYSAYRLAFHDVKAQGLTSLVVVISSSVLNTLLAGLCGALFFIGFIEGEMHPYARLTYVVAALAFFFWTVSLHDDIRIIKRTLGFKSVWTYDK